MRGVTESVVEDAALGWLEELGYAVLYGPDMSPDGDTLAPTLSQGERENYSQVVLENRLRNALARLNPQLPPEALEDAFRKLTRVDAPAPIERNRAIHRMLVKGVPVEYRRQDGSIAGDQARVIDFDNPDKNDWLAVNQFTVAEGQHTRRPDIVLFVNGLPLAVIELKNPADENATVWTAYKQLQTYQAEIPALFAYNEALVVSDGTLARIGALGAGREWFKPWRTIEGQEDASARLTELEVLLRGVFDKRRFLDLVRHFVVFEDGNAAGVTKKMAGYHQFHAVNAAVEETLRATRLAGAVADVPGRYEAGLRPGGEPGDRRVGVVWHTQGSGKSLTMAFYAGRMILEPKMANPTIVVLTDRNDLDDQLFGTFSRCREVVGWAPEQAQDRADLRAKLRTEGGGVVFTTIQKFMSPSATPSPLSSPSGRGEESATPSPLSSPSGRGEESATPSPLSSPSGRGEESATPSPLSSPSGRGEESATPSPLSSPSGRGEESATPSPLSSPSGRGEESAAPSPPSSPKGRGGEGEQVAPPTQPSPNGRGRSEAEGEGDWLLPVLSDRRNIVVLADEAHRSQYDFIDGYARHMRDALPNASFIGFTGTPIDLTDKNTRAVFGDYISVYDIQRAVADGATVPIYYESRLAKLALAEADKPKIDEDFEEATEGEEVERKEKLKTKWAQLEAVVGSPQRVQVIARDIVDHYEKRLAAMQGKAMIVCMSRRICVELYKELITLRPEWHGADDEHGLLKVVMTGSASDPLDWQQHIRNKPKREALAARFRDPTDPFQIVIVRDMWLTGFDAPSLHTMYVDKPMRGHGLMQAIARVNRVFGDKPGGLVVDYLGLADELRQALATYTQSGGTGETAIDQAEAVALMLEKVEVCRGLFHGFAWAKWVSGTPQEKLALLPLAQEHILAQEDGKSRLVRAVTELSQAFALAVPHGKALAIRDDVGFFQAVRSVLVKGAIVDRKTDEELDHAIRQIISEAIVSDDVVDLFAAAGLKKPDISILSDQFLAEVRGMPQKNLAVELLRKLLTGEIRTRSKRNVVQARSFAELLDQSIRKYQNRAIETMQVIDELIGLAKHMREAGARGEALKLTEDEVAFYDALETNDSAVKVLGDETLRTIARELADTVRKNVKIDWTVRENVRAQLRVLVKRILRKYGYPPDKQAKATETVLEQAEVLSEAWTSGG